jgi:16S rRNA (uracil1498-N3)-methyltransferase
LARRYFVSPDQIGENEPLITGSDAHHLRDVIRARSGSEIIVFDGQGTDYRARIVSINPGEVKIVLAEAIRARRESPLAITIAQGFLKDKKMDGLVRQLTELGITRFSPFLAKRSVALPSAKRMVARHQRWLKITQEAVKQCGRSQPMEIDELSTFAQALTQAPSHPLKLIFWENLSHTVYLNQLRVEQPGAVYLMIGPEGGFDQDEIDQALDQGFHVVSMGPRILRAQTAAIAAAVMVQSNFGDMNQKNLDNSEGV